MDIEIEFSRAGLSSALMTAVGYGGVRTLAKLVTAIVPTSAVLALIASLMWLAAALYVFFVVTWQRDDNWLAAGLIIGLTLLCGGVVADLLAQLVTTASLTQTLIGTANYSVGLLLRTILLVPLSGGCVFGARWLTTELGQA
jgi:hypothetical protein